MIKIVDKGIGQANLKDAEESIIASLSSYNNSHYILASPDVAHILISALRKFEGKTGQEVSDQVGIKQETISAYENDRRKMSLPVLDALVSALGYKVSICIEKSGESGEASSLKMLPEELSYNFAEFLKEK